MRLLLSFLIVAFISAGCASQSARLNPGVKLSQFKRVYVEKRLNDNNATDAIIAAELRRRGFDASYGHLTMMPRDTEVVITYDARWTWDFRSYLIELHITANTAHSNKPIATGSYRQPGIVPKEPAEMIAVLFDKFLE
ncbi:MAG: hypothetical protein H7A44_06345 [Opitutaceae bacterium]|nr:hypothetical protein [Cephaloticoccus sp.]MCP5530043.1 hypothetical protein [Opitutaceae bacterium]